MTESPYLTEAQAGYIYQYTDESGRRWKVPVPAPQSHAEPTFTDWAQERTDVLVRFMTELSKATGDGSKKRQAGEKPPWYQDDDHERAIFSHLTKWKAGELVDDGSGAHPLVNCAWRCLAIACKETGNVPPSA